VQVDTAGQTKCALRLAIQENWDITPVLAEGCGCQCGRGKWTEFLTLTETYASRVCENVAKIGHS
jgi:hypothetical protein